MLRAILHAMYAHNVIWLIALVAAIAVTGNFPQDTDAARASIILACFTAVFFAAILALYPENLKAESYDSAQERRKRKRRDEEERRELRNDLQNVKAVHLKISDTTPASTSADIQEVLMLNFGLAENKTANLWDEQNKRQGDQWVCDGRALLFAILLFAASWPWAILIAYLVPTQFVWLTTLCTFIVLTVWIGFRSYANIPVRTIGGVKRFDDQLPGFLAPGLQFLLFERFLPIEKLELIPLQDLVWGPHEEKEIGEELRLHGCSGTEMNPKPGVFRVQLFGTWPLEVDVTVTLRVRRAFKEAWFRWLNDYPDEIAFGKQIGEIISAFLLNRIREITERDKDKKEPAEVREAILNVLKQMPEMTGEILYQLQALGPHRLAGVLIVSIAMSIKIGPELATLFQQLDTARVKLVTRQLEAQGAAAGLAQLRDLVDSVKRKDRPLLEALARQEVQRVFGGQPSGFEMIIAALASKIVQDATSPAAETEK